jgi:hypothetical protein
VGALKTTAIVRWRVKQCQADNYCYGCIRLTFPPLETSTMSVLPLSIPFLPSFKCDGFHTVGVLGFLTVTQSETSRAAP